MNFLHTLEGYAGAVTVDLELERMVHGGVALARTGGGRIALVRGGIPGERVRVDLAERAGVLQGAVRGDEDVLERSPDRTTAGPHPGLDFGFIRYERQLELKREVVADAVARALGGDVEVPEVVPSPATWRYRSAVQPVVAPGGGLGYRRPGSADAVVLESDPVANDAIDAAWRAWRALEIPAGVRELALRGNDDGEVLAALVATVPERDLVPFAHALVRAGFSGVSHAPFDPRGRFRGGSRRLAGARLIRQRYGRFELSVGATRFAQPNPAAAGGLYRALEALAPGGDHAVDLYAGSGVIALHLAARYRRVSALEIDRSSVAHGRKDAERHGVANLEFVRADARRAGVPGDAELVVVDPPRSGLARDLRVALLDSSASTLIYVSCDVATWARDVAHLVGGGFVLERFTPFDFYPHTHHVELLSRLTR